MIFSHLEPSNELEVISNKQRITISERTKAILLSDMNVFHIDKESVSTIKANVGNLSSNIINHIFRCYRNYAHASLEQTLASEKNELINVLEKMDEAQKEIAVECLLEKRREELKQENNERKNRKGFSFTFNVDNENIEYLKTDAAQLEGDFYGDNVGNYIKTVLEEYADLPYVEREKIFYEDVLNKINADLSLENVQMLKLHLYRKISVNGKSEEAIVHMKPYGIRRDLEYHYNYVVGIMKITNNDSGDKWSIASVRLSSIKRCEYMLGNATISNKSKKDIESKIKTYGVQYLSAEENIEEIVVRLDDKGERMYRIMLHMRPMYTKCENGEYTFMCSATQAEYYFLQFEEHAKILKPSVLADLFRRKYASAAGQYEQSDVTNDSPKQ